MNARRRKFQGGNALLEFAIAFFFMWLLFSGVYEFGYSFYVYNRLESAVGDAAQLGAKISYDIGDTGNPTAYQTKLINMVLYGDESAGSATIVPGLTASNVNVSANLDAKGIPNDITIYITGYTISSIFNSFTPTNKPRVTAKFYGSIVCSTC